MKKIFVLLSFLMILSFMSPACADREAFVYLGETYYCGDTLEVRFPDELLVTKQITRNPGSKVVQAQADRDTVLLEIHVQLRNMSDVVYKGLSPDSFKLVGYIREKPLTYLPEIMEPFDYGSKEYYILYDKLYYKDYLFAPLRKIDMILVYRINPIIRDLELHVKPRGNDGTQDQYLDAVYSKMDLEQCDGVFQFGSVRDAETFELTRYYR
ncbi:MAG: hypothetical protein IKP86_11465 [Anaerolineaceae bacterium]|nr:hypothetical protein [Anaerolineaceae bacterium]